MLLNWMFIAFKKIKQKFLNNFIKLIKLCKFSFDRSQKQIPQIQDNRAKKGPCASYIYYIRSQLTPSKQLWRHFLVHMRKTACKLFFVFLWKRVEPEAETESRRARVTLRIRWAKVEPERQSWRNRGMRCSWRSGVSRRRMVDDWP